MHRVSESLLLAIFWISFQSLLANTHVKLKPRTFTNLTNEDQRFNFLTVENHTVFYLEQGEGTLLVGTTEKLYYMNFTGKINKTVEFKADDYQNCQGQTNCKNFLMVLDRFDGKLLVCGTNAYKPRCWHLEGFVKDKTQYGSGFSPFVPDPNFLILFSGGEVFSTINKFQNNGKIPRFRRIYGKDIQLYTNDHLMQNPQFVKATVIEQEESYKDKIYYFFREDNQQNGVDHDFVISRVAQLCKGDGGGEGSVAATMWTTFLKARLVCSYDSQKKLFNRLHDVFIVKSENWSETRVYGIFSNPWGYTAICVYSIGDIDRVFRTSNLKGNSKPLPNPRPGECLVGGHSTPTETFNMADNYPEVEDEVKPIGNQPLFHSRFHYTKIVVDELEKYNVLLLATDNGLIHKLVEFNREVVNILEIHPFRNQTPIQSMTLDSETKRLYVGSSAEVVQVPLDMCDVYKVNCESCILDPYCVWDKCNCSSILLNKRLWNATHGSQKTLCHTSGQRVEPSRSVQWHQDNSVVYVEPFSRYFISCHVTSHHATYSWMHNDVKKLDCLHGQSTCIYHINNMTDSHYGTYTCISDEEDVRRTVIEYRLVKAHGSVGASCVWLVVLQVAFCYLLSK